MSIINTTNFRKNIFEILDHTIKYNEMTLINTKSGNAVLLSEDEYNGLIETIYLLSSPTMQANLLEGKNTPLSECISEEDIDW